MLDTNVCVDILRGRSRALRGRLLQQRAQGLCVSSVVVAELYYGAARSADPPKNQRLIRRFLANLPSVAFDDRAAQRYGQLRAVLEGAGTPIGPNDLLIAATALAGGLTLVTSNLDEFRRVPDLQVESWA